MRPARSVDQRVLGAGTTVRFGLLVVLLLAASATAISGFVDWLADSDNDALGCSLAAGYDPSGSWLANMFGPVSAGAEAALSACLDRYVQPGPWWGPMLGIGLLLGVAGAFLWGIPAWKGRRSQVVELRDVDVRGDLAPALEELVRTAGLARAPRFVINPGRVTTNAVVFGRPGRHTVCLDGGLVARRLADPTGFRAVVLHELAHIRNRDVLITYATVALWRTFLIAVLVPQAVLLGWELNATADSVVGPGDRPLVIRELVLLAFLTVLVYLTRADILRSREIYADLDALAWGADPGHWPDTRAKTRHLFARFLELWRTHPRWDLRRQSLTEPVVLFGIQPLPTFLTGAASVILGAQVPSLLSAVFPGARWLEGLTPWLTALPITVIIGVALWRAVAHAVLTDRRPPSGVRTGMWLGAGLVVGELMLDRASGNQWFPGQPVVLAVHFLVAVVITWWTVQCAQLLIRAWRGRTLRPAMPLGLAVSWLAFTFWFGWWQSTGYFFATGFLFDDRLALERIFPGAATSHSGVIAVVSPVLAVLGSLDVDPLLTWVTTAMWLVPLLAWTVRPATRVPRWVRNAMPDTADPPLVSEQLPSLRKPLRVALLGGLLGAMAVAAVMAYQHTWQPPLHQRGGGYFLVYLSLLLPALAIAPIAAAAATALIVRRYRLLMALAAAGVAAQVAFAAAFVLSATDGCLGPLNTLSTRCHWQPETLWPLLTQRLMPAVLGPGMFVAATVALLVAVVRRLVERGRPAHSDPSRRARWAAKRVGIAAICVTAIGLTAASITPASANASSFTRQQVVPALATTPVAPEVRRTQVWAWLKYGGNDLIDRFLYTDMVELGDVLTAPTVDPVKIGSLCIDINQVMRSANAYLPIPDPVLQADWSKMIGTLTQTTDDCQRAIREVDQRLYQTSVDELVNVMTVAVPLVGRIQAEAGL